MGILDNQSIIYNLLIQKKDGDNNILMTIPKIPEVNIPDSIVGNTTHSVPDGSLDLPLPILDAGGVDFIVLFSTQEISFKVNSPASQPIFVRAGGCALLDSKDILSVLITNASTVATPAKVMFIQAKSQALA